MATLSREREILLRVLLRANLPRLLRGSPEPILVIVIYPSPFAGRPRRYSRKIHD